MIDPAGKAIHWFLNRIDSGFLLWQKWGGKHI